MRSEPHAAPTGQGRALARPHLGLSGGLALTRRLRAVCEHEAQRGGQGFMIPWGIDVAHLDRG